MIERCVRETQVGGYVTKGLLRLTNYLRNNPRDAGDPQWRKKEHQIRRIVEIYANVPLSAPTAWFLTLSIEDGQEHLSPGNFDWMVPMTFTYIMLHLISLGGPNVPFYADAWSTYVDVAISQRQATWPWWGGITNSLSQNSTTTTTTTTPKEIYECDTSLGIPHAGDCSQLDYSMFGAPFDTFQIDPGVPKILSSSKKTPGRTIMFMCFCVD